MTAIARKTRLGRRLTARKDRSAESGQGRPSIRAHVHWDCTWSYIKRWSNRSRAIWPRVTAKTVPMYSLYLRRGQHITASPAKVAEGTANAANGPRRIHALSVTVRGSRYAPLRMKRESERSGKTATTESNHNLVQSRPVALSDDGVIGGGGSTSGMCSLTVRSLGDAANTALASAQVFRSQTTKLLVPSAEKPSSKPWVPPLLVGVPLNHTEARVGGRRKLR